MTQMIVEGLRNISSSLKHGKHVVFCQRVVIATYKQPRESSKW